jgi:hypothetical protein
MKQKKKLKVCTNSLQPKLNNDHQLNWLFHIYERWFYLVKDGGRCILTADEEPLQWLLWHA